VKILRVIRQALHFYLVMTRYDREMLKRGYTRAQIDQFWFEARTQLLECPLLSLETIAEGKLNGNF
jgi:hypothetical protein